MEDIPLPDGSVDAVISKPATGLAARLVAFIGSGGGTKVRHAADGNREPVGGQPVQQRLGQHVGSRHTGERQRPHQPHLDEAEAPPA